MKRRFFARFSQRFNGFYRIVDWRPGESTYDFVSLSYTPTLLQRTTKISCFFVRLAGSCIGKFHEQDGALSTQFSLAPWTASNLSPDRNTNLSLSSLRPTWRLHSYPSSSPYASSPIFSFEALERHGICRRRLGPGNAKETLIEFGSGDYVFLRTCPARCSKVGCVVLYLLTRCMRPERLWQRRAAALMDSSAAALFNYTKSCPQLLRVKPG